MSHLGSCILRSHRHPIFFACVLLSFPIYSIPIEQNALASGLLKIFPTLAEKGQPYIDFDRSGDRRTEPGVPESFNVLIRELQSLCLDVELMKKQQSISDTALAAD